MDVATASVHVERDRERDVRKYYKPWLDLNGLDAASAQDPTPPSSATQAPYDTTLTALAQLGALRLNAKRCLISLIDTDFQYVLAEATQTLSLTNEHCHAPGDHLLLGNVTLPRGEGIDSHVFGSRWEGKDAAGHQYSLAALIVNDLAEDARFKHHQRPSSDSKITFYAGVPIVTKQGHEIGVYSVSDVLPRSQSLAVDQVLFMQDVARIIADHFERLKLIVDRQQDELLVRSIASFIEDLSAFKHKISEPVDMPLEDHEYDDTRATDPQTTPSTESPTSESLDAKDNSVDLTRADQPSAADPEGVQDQSQDIPRYLKESDAYGHDASSTAANNIRQIFSRASQTIQGNMDIKGCLFLDASPSFYTTQAEHHTADTDSLDGSCCFDDDDFETNVSSTRTNFSIHDETNPQDKEPYHSALAAQPDDTLADSVKLHASVLGHSIVDHSITSPPTNFMRRDRLRHCLSQYPFGKIFYLENGQATSLRSTKSNATVTGGGGLLNQALANPHSYHPTRTKLPKSLLDKIPGAKWLIFLPLFNSAHNQWFAASFLWDDHDAIGDLEAAMPYLKTFGSCIMSEVSSMEALNTNISKSTFIASISHDLRSPLHGMLGSLEFLEDTITSAYQTSLLDSIETCGRTLLDTIDHLLDFAKINNLNREGSADRIEEARNKGEGLTLDASDRHVSTFDIGLLLEEVVEAVFAGQTFRKSKLRGRDPVDEASAQIQAMSMDKETAIEEQIHSGSAKFSGRVFFILDIHRADSCCVRGKPGAIRRIIMNIVGNAIKYCHAGAIEIVLNVKTIANDKAEVQLNVRDTGVGMSQYFLENQLFRAFSQEDSFAPGAGLGMSIASQIVQSLHGKISVRSEKAVGTHVQVILPLESAPQLQCDAEDVLMSAARIASGKGVCLLNPMIKHKDTSKGKLSKLTASIARTCQDWFGMSFSQSRTVDESPDSSVYIYCEPPPIEYLIKHHSERKRAGKEGKDAALLIICTNAFEAAALRSAGVSQLIALGRVVEVISQPVGVRKLAKVLLQSISRVEDVTSPALETIQPSTSLQVFPTEYAQKRASQVDWNSNSMVYDDNSSKYRPSISSYKWKSEQPQLHETVIEGQIPGVEKSEDNTLASMPSSNLEPRNPITTREPRLPHVLLVDDNAINLKLLVTFMKKIKLPYAEAVNGLEAYEKFCAAEEPFDFVLMDLQMPVMDGMESTRKIRQYEAGDRSQKPSIIIAITGVGHESTRKEAMDAGMSQYLTKPVKFKALQQLLQDQQPDLR